MGHYFVFMSSTINAMRKRVPLYPQSTYNNFAKVPAPLSPKSLRVQMTHFPRPLRKSLLIKLHLRRARSGRSSSKLQFDTRPAIKSRNGSTRFCVSMRRSFLSLCTKAVHILPRANCFTSVEIRCLATTRPLRYSFNV